MKEKWGGGKLRKIFTAAGLLGAGQVDPVTANQRHYADKPISAVVSGPVSVPSEVKSSLRAEHLEEVDAEKKYQSEEEAVSIVKMFRKNVLQHTREYNRVTTLKKSDPETWQSLIKWDALVSAPEEKSETGHLLGIATTTLFEAVRYFRVVPEIPVSPPGGHYLKSMGAVAIARMDMVNVNFQAFKDVSSGHQDVIDCAYARLLKKDDGYEMFTDPYRP